MSAALPAEVRDLLDAILAAIDIPYPATVGDAVRHQEILAERVMHTTITLRQVLARQRTQFPADLSWETAYLREQLAIHPPTGYRTGPWPGKPVETAQQGTQGGDRR
jgi:hypothetical protein